MNKIERVDAVLQGDRADRPPVSLWYHFGIQHSSGERFAKITLEYFDRYDFDFLKVMNDYFYPAPVGLDAIKTKVRAAMSYPSFVLIFAILATAFLLLKIVPTFTQIYANLGQQLPSLTLLVVSISDAVRENVLITLFILLVIFLWPNLYERLTETTEEASLVAQTV